MKGIRENDINLNYEIIKQKMKSNGDRSKSHGATITSTVTEQAAPTAKVCKQ